MQPTLTLPPSKEAPRDQRTDAAMEEAPYSLEPMYFVGENLAFRVINSRGECVDEGPYLTEEDGKAAAAERWDWDTLIRCVEARAVKDEELHPQRSLVWKKLLRLSRNDVKVAAFKVKEMLKSKDPERSHYFAHHIACRHILTNA